MEAPLKEPYVRDDLNFISVIDLLVKWRNVILVTMALVLGLSIFLTSKLVMPPLYKSSAIIYPAFEEGLSTDDPSEQLIQLMSSMEVSMNVINKYNLATHYGLKDEESQDINQLLDVFTDHVSIDKTQYASVKVAVYDEDPVMAANIANSLIEYGDAKMRDLEKSKYLEAVHSTKIEMEELQRKVTALEDSLRTLQQITGIYNPSQEIAILSEEYLRVRSKLSFENSKLRELENNRTHPSIDTAIIYTKSRVAGHKSSLEDIEPTVIRLFDRGNVLESIKSKLEKARESYLHFKVAHERALYEFNREKTYTHLVTAAIAGSEPAKPNRLLIIVLIMCSAAFLLLLVIAGIEKYKNNRGKLVIHAS